MFYDVVLLAILAYTTFRGAARGMAWQLAAIAALVLCFLFATPLSLIIAPRLALDPPLNRWVAMLGIYLAFSFACFVAARMLRGSFEAWKFEEYDRHLGAILGFIKGATICLVLTFFVVCLLPSFRDDVLRSTSGRFAARVIHQLAAVMPSEIDGIVEPYVRRYEEGLIAAAEGLPDRSGDDEAVEADRDSRPGGMRFQLPAVIDELLGDSTDPSPESRPGDENDDAPEPADRTSPDKDWVKSVGPWLETISGLLADSEGERQGYREGIAALLRGIPPAVASDVLQDWQADLRGLENDPDPETDLTTPLDIRILRSLRAARIDFEKLPRPVRDRLRGAEDR
ncbi:MAG: CvpA family protein [Planctomycetaceae bacterium]